MPDLESIRQLLALAIPNSIQTLFFAGGFVALFWIIGKVDVDSVAVSNVIINLLKVAALPGVAMGLAAMTLVSESLGRRETADASRWGWNVVSLAMVLLVLIAMPALLVPEMVLAGFLHDDRLIQLASLPLRITAAGVIFDAVGMVLMNSLIGAGAARQAMTVSVICQWVVGLPLCYVLGVTLEFGLLGIWIGQVVPRILQAIILSIIWRNGTWQANRL